MCAKIAIILLVFSINTISDGAKILAIVSAPSYSHQIAFRPLFDKLTTRGHEVTYITTHPLNESSSKIREISTADAINVFEKYNVTEYVSSKNYTIVGFFKKMFKMFDEGAETSLCHPELKKLIKRGETFDLVFFEYLNPAHMVLGHVFNCPYIGIVSMDGHAAVHSAIGNPVHPIVNPDLNLGVGKELTFKQRLMSTVSVIIWDFAVNTIFIPVIDSYLKTYYGNIPSLFDMAPNISMIFTNANPLFNNVRALGPATINVGGKIHMTESKPLPKDLQKLLDEAKNGVIYFSLGSNVKAASLNESLRQTLLDVFGELPYTVLWKFSENLEGVPKNVHINKWFPQQSILKHPNVKLFITQGGLQSLEESIYNYVPLIGIPFFGDQFHNVERVVEQGFGFQFYHDELEKTSFKAAIIEVITNPKYRDKVKEMADLTLDQPMTGLEKAVWWTEYVIRHKGAPFLQNPMKNLPWYQYLLLDVIAFLILCAVLFVCCIYFFFKLIIKSMRLIYSILKKKEKLM